MKTAADYFYEAHRKVNDALQTFVFDILPTLTLEEFERLCAKRPEVYEKYRPLVEHMKGKYASSMDQAVSGDKALVEG